MNEYKVDYSTDALADLETIYFNILLTSLNHVMANDVIQAIKDKVDSLYSFPLRFQIFDESPWKEKGIRSVICRHYYILYLVDEEKRVVTIYRICNTKQDINNLIN